MQQHGKPGMPPSLLSQMGTLNETATFAAALFQSWTLPAAMAFHPSPRTLWSGHLSGFMISGLQVTLRPHFHPEELAARDLHFGLGFRLFTTSRTSR